MEGGDVRGLAGDYVGTSAFILSMLGNHWRDLSSSLVRSF